EDPGAGERRVPFSKVLYIEQDDFREDPPKKYFRLAPGREVRLRSAYFVTCTGFTKDPASGEVTEVRCTYDPATRGGDAPDGRKVKATLHWVSAAHAINADVRLYDRLFPVEEPGKVDDYRPVINPASLEVVAGARVEPSAATAPPGTRFQCERIGYFCVDTDSTPERPVFNRTVTLKDTWAKIEQKAVSGWEHGPWERDGKRGRGNAAEGEGLGMGRDLTAIAVPVLSLVQYAYDVPVNPSPRLSGLSAWRDSYDVDAEAPAHAIPAGPPESQKRGRTQRQIR